jgi:gluconolactonase
MNPRALPLLLVLAAALLPAQTYTLGPDSQPKDGVPKGTVTKYVLKPGRFFPGTPHNYSVYVPAQYDSAKPAPFMIFLDGSGALGNGERVPVVFDNLIASHDLPPMIGIFIDPGVLPALSGDAQNRYERIFEYDSLSDRFATFLIDELIPEVAKSYNLSKNPDDRGLSGVSTGAVGAFMAAWNRPDQFHRVLSFIGTYVAMKGADSLSAAIRRTEPKPIRIFLQDGANDHIAPGQPWGTFFAGSWPVNNQVMYEAFQYSGYDAKLVIGSGGHDMKQGGAIMPDALRWLWRGYPAPITVHEPAVTNQPGWDPRGKVYATVYADKPWQKIEGSYSSAISPTADRDGNVYFADPAAHRIDKSTPDGKITLFKQVTATISALAYGAGNRLYVAEPAIRRIVSYAIESGTASDEKIIVRNVAAHNIVLTAKGVLYCTDQERRSVDLIDAAGHARAVYTGGEIAVPEGIALSPDQAMLIVSDAQSRFSWSFQIAADGSLVNGEPFFRLEMPETGWQSRAGGIAEDSTGQSYFATPLGIQVCEASGRMIEILNAPVPGSAVTSVAFAGANPAWLYATEGNSLYRRPVKITPAYIWAPAKPPKPLL